MVSELTTNPVALIPRNAEYDRARDRVVSDEELRRLWEALEGRNPPVRNRRPGSRSCSVASGGVLRLDAISGAVSGIAEGEGYQLRDLRRTAETRLASLRG